MTPFQEKERTFILLVDIYRCFTRHWIKILLFMIIFLGVGLWHALTQPVKYQVYGSFKEAKGESEQLLRKQAMHNLLQQVGVANSAQSCHIIKSFTLLRKVVEELGLQATVAMETSWERIKRTIYENWLAERKILLKDVEQFTFSHVKYEAEVPTIYTLLFRTPNEFEIRNSADIVVALGKLGDLLQFDEIALTLEKPPKNVKLHYPYRLYFEAMIATLSQLIAQLEINPHIKDGTVYEFIFPHRDRKLAKKVIDSVMEKYQTYLREETERVSLEQITYLEKRKNELCLKMNEYLRDHVDYLKKSLGTKGFLNLSQHLQHMAYRKQKFLDQHLSIENDHVRLAQWEHNSKGIAMSGELATLQQEMREYKKQRDSIDLAFSFRKKGRVKRFYVPYAPKEETWYGYQDQLHHMETQQTKIKLAEQGSSSAFALLCPSLFAAITRFSEERTKEWARIYSFKKQCAPAFMELNFIRQKKSELKKMLEVVHNQEEGSQLVHQAIEMQQEDFIYYLRHQLRIVTLQESILKERLFYPKKDRGVLQGIDLATARKLYCEYIHIRDDYESKIRQLTFSKEHCTDPDFEYISLVQLLPDSVSQNLAYSIGELVQSMRDTRNLSERDLERMTQRLKRGQENLQRHIDQTIKLTRLQSFLTEERLETLQEITLDLLSQEISLLDQQIKDRVQQQKNTLKLEQQLIRTQLKEIESELSLIPEQWLKERQLEFSSDMNMNMLESMVKMVESKNIEHNSIQIQSKPIDLGYAMVNPIPPRLKIFALVGVFIGLLVGLALVVAIDFSRGFPLTLKNLRLQGKKVCGRFKKRKSYHYLSEMGKENIQVLRWLSSLIPNRHLGSVVTVLSGKGSKYAFPLGELLVKEEKNVLLIDLNEETKGAGLFTYLQGKDKEYSIKKQAGIDCIPIGQQELFSIELFKKPLFQQFLVEQKRQYNVILFQASFLPKSPEAQFFMEISDFISLTLDDESNEDLSPYYNWEEDGKVLAFVAN